MVSFSRLREAITTASFVMAAAAAVIPRGDSSLTLQAETATLSDGARVETALSGYSGAGYVDGLETGAGKITFQFPSTSSQDFDISIRYAAVHGDKVATLVLNGVSGDLNLPASAGFTFVSAGRFHLNAGGNVFEILSNWGWYNIDSITLTPSHAGQTPTPSNQTVINNPEASNIHAALANPNANADATALYNYLRSIYGQKILAGQQELVWADWVAQQTGRTPALVAVDLMDYTPLCVARGAVGTAVEEAITHHQRGGIVSALWHWRSPSGALETADQPWYKAFYTWATTFDVAAALATPGGRDYQLLLEDIDAVSVQLARLRDAGVPVLWRPLHEAEGAWFWWGAKGSAATKQLWWLMYDRMTNLHRLDNLVWVWNSVDAEWYPGDETVDILSADVYEKGHGTMAEEYEQLAQLGGSRKMSAAAEVGAMPMPDQLQADKIRWLWFTVWSDTFINNVEWNSLDVLKQVYNSHYVLTLDEIQGWRTTVEA